MKYFRKLFLFICLTFSVFSTAFGAISSECEKYSDCDMLVACEITLEVEKAITGLAADYEGAAARAASYKQACATYPDKFKKNIDIVANEKPEIRIAIDWKNVRNRMTNGSQAGFELYDLELVQTIVDNVFGPDTQAQKLFFEALATEYVRAFKSDNSAFLDDAFVLNFLSTDDNIEKYRTPLRDLTGDDVAEIDTDYGIMKIDVSWDEILIEVSNVLDKVNRKRGAIVCENNRSYQFSIDAAGWIATIVAAIATFYAGGAGGAAVATGRAALGAGLKASAKGLAKVGAKDAAKKLAKKGTKQVAKGALKIEMKSTAREAMTYAATKGAARGLLKDAGMKFIKQVGTNLTTKWIALTATGAAVWGIGTAVSKNQQGSTFYSYLNSDLDKSFMNCHDLDHNEGCYTVCGDGKGEDDYLNKYALKPVLGKTYCVNPGDYVLYEIKSDGSRGDVLVYDDKHHNEIIKKLKASVVDKAHGGWYDWKWYPYKGCDWNEDDIDMYFGFYVYDPDTLEITKEAMVIDDAIRLDD